MTNSWRACEGHPALRIFRVDQAFWRSLPLPRPHLQPWDEIILIREYTFKSFYKKGQPPEQPCEIGRGHTEPEDSKAATPCPHLDPAWVGNLPGRAWKSKMKALSDLMSVKSPLPSSQATVSSYGGREPSGVSFIRALSSFKRAPPS